MLSGEDGIEVIAWIRGVTGGGLPDPVDRFVSATGELKIIGKGNTYPETGAWLG